MMDAKTLADEIEQQITDNPYIAKTVMFTGEKWRAVISFLRSTVPESPSGMQMMMARKATGTARDAVIEQCAAVVERMMYPSPGEAADAIRELKHSRGDDSA